MREKTTFWMSIILSLFFFTVVGSAQTNIGSCPGSVTQAYTFAEAACDSVASGQACIGNGSATVTSLSNDADLLINPGDQFDLTNTERLQTLSMTADAQNWTVVLARFEVTDTDLVPVTIDAIVIGDVILWREQNDAPVVEASGAILPATIEAAAGVIVRQDAVAGSSNIWQLLDGARVQAIGRSGNGEWIRILIPSPNGGTGWVYNRFIAVDGGSQALPYHTNFSPVPNPATATGSEATSPQRLRMESLPVSDDCAEATDSGVVLQSPTLDRPIELEMNGVTLQLAGTTFLTAQVGGNMSVFSLEGTTGLIVDDQRTELSAGASVQVALDASLSPIAAPGAGQPYTDSVSAELEYLPLQLLSRNISTPEMIDIAEAAPICPSAIPQTYSNLGLFCQELATGYACLGNAGPGMARLGDVYNFSQIERLSLQVEDDPPGIWPAALLQLEADTSGGSTAVATLMLLGEAELINRNAAPMTDPANQSADSLAPLAGLEATVQVAGSISVGDQPRVDTDLVTMLDNLETVTALQRSIDQQWILIETGEGERGWIVAQYLRLTDGIDALPIYDPDQPPMSEGSAAADVQDETVDGGRLALDLHSRDRFPGCGDVPPGGILIQAPSDIDGVLLMSINGADLDLTGTAYFAATDEIMTLYSLEGAVSIDEPGASSMLFAGEQMTLPLSMGQIAENAAGVSRKYSTEDALRFASLPIDRLPRAIDVHIPASMIASTVVAEVVVDESTSETGGLVADDTSTVDDASNAETQTDDSAAACVINAGGLARNLRQGPGTDFQIVGVLHVGQSVDGESQKRGAYGLYWYHTGRGWIRFDAGETTAGCARLPFYIATVGEFEDDETGAPPLQHEVLGDVCAAGGAVRAATIRGSGSTYHEFSGLWTGQAGVSVTFNADIRYFHESFGNVIALVNEDGSLWLGSQTDTAFTINFAATRSFRVRVSGLLGDYVTLRVSC